MKWFGTMRASLRAPAPAVVVSVCVKPGDTVAAGDRLAVLEAMKMETQIVAQFPGKVRQVMTIPNVQVDGGAPLLKIDPHVLEDVVIDAERVTFDSSYSSPQKENTLIESSYRQSLDYVKQLMLGFDVDPALASRGLSSRDMDCPLDDDEAAQIEDQILNIFVDSCSLFQRDPEVNHRASGEEPSAENYLFSYLRMLDTRGRSLPTTFLKIPPTRAWPL